MLSQKSGMGHSVNILIVQMNSKDIIIKIIEEQGLRLSTSTAVT